MEKNELIRPEVVVQRQLDAYNAKNLEALLAIYHEDAQLFEHPDRLLAAGTEQLAERFSVRFTEPHLRARLLNRLVVGSNVVDHEVVERTFPEGPGTVEMIMIYEVRGTKIARTWSILGKKVFGALTAQQSASAQQ